MNILRKLNEADFQSYEFGIGGPIAASFIMGLDPRPEVFYPTLRQLERKGYTGNAYRYSKDVLLSGDAELLPELMRNVRTDFAAKSKGYSAEQHFGVSLGAAIAWDLQKHSENTLPGVYGAAGANAARLVMRDLGFRGVVKLAHKIDVKAEYEKKGESEESLNAKWHELHQPPDTGMTLVLGGLDYIVKAREMAKKINTWRQQGIDIEVIKIPLASHSGAIDWYANNIAAILAR